MADANENLKIKKIKLGSATYDIYATSVDASAIQFGENNQIPEGAISSVPVSAITAVNESAISSIPASAITAIPESAISGTDIPWESLSSLAVSSSNMTSTTGIMTPAEIQKAIDAQIATVYKVKGTLEAEVGTEGDDKGKITNMPTNAENGDVWNIKLPEGTTSAELDGQKITDGDNVVFVKATEEGEVDHWDKLAGSVDITTMATKEWVESYVSGGETGENVREKFDSLWNEVSSYIDEDVTSANATALWGNVTSAITSGISAQVWDKTIQTAEELSAIAEGGTTSGEYLVGAGAITEYIKDQIDSTIQETIDIASYDTTKSAFVDTKGNVTTSGVPNAGAVTAFADHQYIHKNDISYSAETLIIDNLF